MRRRVYISYDRTNQRAVAELYEDLVALGQQAWLDRSLPGGTDWWRRVVTNIEHCDVFVSMMSAHALSSPIWEAELEAACQFGKRLLPVLIESVPDSYVPQVLGGLQRIDYRNLDRTSMAALIESLRSVPAAPAVIDRPIPPPPPGFDFEPQVLLSSAGYLAPPDQARLLEYLERLLGEGLHHNAGLQMLREFRSRDETTARVARRIDEITADVGDEPVRSGLFRLEMTDLPTEPAASVAETDRTAFVSYSRSDRVVANELVGDIERAGWKTWVDRKLPGGEPWWNEVIEQLQDCDGLVLLASSASLSSRACLSEIGYARKLGKPILVAAIGDDLDDVVNSTVPGARSLRYRVDDKDSLADLYRQLAGLPAPPPLPQPLPSPPSVPATYLFDLRSRVESDVELSPSDQQQMIDQLRKYHADGHSPDELRNLAVALHSRSEITRRASDDIAAFLTAIGDGGADPLSESSSPGRASDDAPPTVDSEPDPRVEAREATTGSAVAGEEPGDHEAPDPHETMDRGTGSQGDSYDMGRPTDPGGPRRGRRWVAVAVVLLLLAGGAVAASALMSSDEEPDDSGDFVGASQDGSDTGLPGTVTPPSDRSFDPAVDVGPIGAPEVEAVLGDIEDLEETNLAYVDWLQSYEAALLQNTQGAVSFDQLYLLVETAAVDANSAAIELERQLAPLVQRLENRDTSPGSPAEAAQSSALSHYAVWVQFGYAYPAALQGWLVQLDLPYDQGVLAQLTQFDQNIIDTFSDMCSALQSATSQDEGLAGRVVAICNV